jgi:hypothetical protein
MYQTFIKSHFETIKTTHYHLKKTEAPPIKLTTFT